MTTLVAVAFPHESTASAAAEDVRWLALDVTVDAEAVAVVSRDRAGGLHVTTNHGVTGGTQWGIFWVLLFAAQPAKTREPRSRPGRSPFPRRERHAVDDTFRRHLRDLVMPGSSALLLAVEDLVSQEMVRELTRLGGILVTWGLKVDARLLIESALRGTTAPGANSRLWPADDGDEPTPQLPAGLLVRTDQTCGMI
jgi:uncharacterized membrane protein